MIRGYLVRNKLGSTIFITPSKKAFCKLLEISASKADWNYEFTPIKIETKILLEPAIENLEVELTSTTMTIIQPKDL